MGFIEAVNGFLSRSDENHDEFTREDFEDVQEAYERLHEAIDLEHHSPEEQEEIQQAMRRLWKVLFRWEGKYVWEDAWKDVDDL